MKLYTSWRIQCFKFVLNWKLTSFFLLWSDRKLLHPPYVLLERFIPHRHSVLHWETIFMVQLIEQLTCLCRDGILHICAFWQADFNVKLTKIDGSIDSTIPYLNMVEFLWVDFMQCYVSSAIWYYVLRRSSIL